MTQEEFDNIMKDIKTKALLTLFASEMQDTLNSIEWSSFCCAEMQMLIDKWCLACNLHPELIKTLSEDATKKIKLGQPFMDEVIKLLEEKPDESAKAEENHG